MNKLFVEPTVLGQWHRLVTDSESCAGIHLKDDVESYLVFLLAKASQNPELLTRTIAFDYLHAHELTERQAKECLKEVGDHCLLYSGLFPGLAARRNVSISYFVRLGISAYGEVAEMSQKNVAKMYDALRDSFVSMLDVLQAMHAFSEQHFLTPLEAEDLWRSTGSIQALKQLHEYTNVIAVPSRLWKEICH